jgi:hypothetical protein
MPRLSLSPQEWRWALCLGPAGLFVVAGTGYRMLHAHNANPSQNALVYALIALGYLFMAIHYLALPNDRPPSGQGSSGRWIITNRMAGAWMLGTALLEAYAAGDSLSWW